jgi:hypothetical protein
MKTDFTAIILYLKRVFLYTSAPIVIFIIILTAIAGYMIYSKETGGPVADKTMYPREDKQARTVTRDVNPEAHLGGAEAKKQEKIHEEPISVSGPGMKKDDSSDTKKQEALEKMRRPFSSHTMTEDEKRFKEIALQTQPVSNLIVHDTGVVFFWANPKDASAPQKRKEIMEGLAHLYRDNCRYEKPVTVVFLISGRPAQSLQFFKE